MQSIGGGGGLGGSASALSTVVGTGDSVGGTVQSSVGGSGGPGRKSLMDPYWQKHGDPDWSEPVAYPEPGAS